MSAPMFQHDCWRCSFLGTFNRHDLYYCPQGTLPTVVARYGDDGPDYKSGLTFSEVDPELWEAAERARSRGLL